MPEKEGQGIWVCEVRGMRRDTKKTMRNLKKCIFRTKIEKKALKRDRKMRKMFWWPG